MMNRTFLTASAIVLTFVCNQAAEASFPKVKSRCAEQMEKLAQSWNSTGEWKEVAGNFYSPTNTTERWVELSPFKKEGFRLTLLMPQGENILTYFPNSNCETQTKITPALSSDKVSKNFGEFDDRDLAKLAFDKKTVFFYAWSPHMPVSLKPYKDAEAAAKKHSIEIIPLLDPVADERGAKDAATKYGIPLKGSKLIATETLKALGIELHYPSYGFMKKGDLVSLTVASARSSEKAYEELMKKFLLQ